MILRYVLTILSYAALGGLLMPLIARQHPGPGAAVTFAAVWLLGFAWLSAYVLAGSAHAAYLLKLMLGMGAAAAAFAGLIWLALELV